MTGGLALEGIRLRLGAFALRGVSLAVAPGEVAVILGPNGTGKSVTLEVIAGFHRPQAGRVLIGGRDVTALPPEARRVGFTLQNFGLFPHLTVAGNIGLGVRERAARQRTVAALLDRFGIARLAGRLPASLSPGEKQRTALARALAAAPDLFLFDEPFSALDAPTRTALRQELRDFLRETGLPAVFVTHDLADAWALADRVAVMRDGAVVQSGPPGEVFRHPADRFVAELAGVENILVATVAGRDRVAVSGQEIRASGPGLEAAGALLCIRAGDVILASARPPDLPEHVPATRLPARIVSVEDRQTYLLLCLDCGFPLIAAVGRQEARRHELYPGAVTAAWIEASAAHVIPAG